jgi:hypothetical protein
MGMKSLTEIWWKNGIYTYKEIHYMSQRVDGKEERRSDENADHSRVAWEC